MVENMDIQLVSFGKLIYYKVKLIYYKVNTL